MLNVPKSFNSVRYENVQPAGLQVQHHVLRLKLVNMWNFGAANRMPLGAFVFRFALNGEVWLR